jgi:hypothetical protein
MWRGCCYKLAGDTVSGWHGCYQWLAAMLLAPGGVLPAAYSFCYQRSATMLLLPCGYATKGRRRSTSGI